MKKTNNIYIYDNTFTGLLTLIKFLINNHTIPLNIKNEFLNRSLFEKYISLNLKNDEIVIEQFVHELGINIFNIIYYVYLSNDENKEIIIFYFILSYLKYKKNVIYMRNLKYVSLALKIAKYVSHENHKMKGFIRFKELNNNILYAEFEPVNNVIFLLANHFKKRLKNEFWIIKDVKRNILCLYDQKNIKFLENVTFIPNEISNDELSIESLWKNFYKTIGIKGRKNDRCRQNFMPKKYWKYIVEMSDENEKSN